MEHCKSCITEPVCNNIGYEEDIRVNCPCRMCLVKVACRESCEDYQTFWKVKGFYERYRKEQLTYD